MGLHRLFCARHSCGFAPPIFLVVGNAFSLRALAGSNLLKVVAVADPLLGAPEYGIEDARGAEIHYVVRTHGPVIPGFEYEMTHTFNGCCQLNGLPDDPRLGPVGPNTCANLQFAMHLP